MTARQIVWDLNHLRDDGTGNHTIDNEGGSFTCGLVKPVSVDEHIKKLARSEVMNLALRLVLATVFAIPTFIFGIVAMSLLSKHHPFRVWVEEPIWVGNASRASWILLILSTPVYLLPLTLSTVRQSRKSNHYGSTKTPSRVACSSLDQ